MTETAINIKDNKRNYRIFLIVLFLLSLFMVCFTGPLTDYVGHDYLFHLRRFNVLADALREGVYPIYLDYENLDGYGYFTKAFYPDLILLPFALLSLLTGTVFAYNVMIFVLTFLCGFFTYKLAEAVFKNTFAAAISALLYTFSAYHLYDWYLRSALGEALSFTFLPLIFLGLYHILHGDKSKWYILVIGYTLMIYTHLLSSVMTFIVLIMILLISYKAFIKEPKRIAYILLAGVVTLFLTASYILPMGEQMLSNTFYYSTEPNITGQTKLGLNKICWGFLSGFIYPENTTKIGVGLLLIVGICLRLFIRKKTPYLKVADVCVILGLLLILMMSVFFPWGRLPLGFIQFPSRFYLFVSLFFAMAGGYYLALLLKTKKQYIIAGSLIVLLTLVVIVRNNDYYMTKQTAAGLYKSELVSEIPSVDNGYNLGGLEYIPVKVPSYRYIHQRGDSVKTLSGEVAVSNLKRNGRVLSFDISSAEMTELELPLLYYKGYRAVLNDKTVSLSESPAGLIQISPQETGNIQVYYAGTTMQKISWYVTLLSALAFCIYIFVSRKKKETK